MPEGRKKGYEHLKLILHKNIIGGIFLVILILFISAVLLPKNYITESYECENCELAGMAYPCSDLIIPCAFLHISGDAKNYNCTDTDGTNYFSKGDASFFNYKKNKQEKVVDKCYIKDREIILMEYLCKKGDKNVSYLGYDLVRCNSDFSCIDGACIPRNISKYNCSTAYCLINGTFKTARITQETKDEDRYEYSETAYVLKTDTPITTQETNDTFYIDATKGNDNNTGLSPDKAWKTISKVNSLAFKPGDKILFKKSEIWKGESLEASSSGTYGKPIFYGSYGTGDKPLIDMSGSTRPGIKARNIKNIIFDDLAIKGSTGVQISAIHLLDSSNITLKNMELYEGDIAISLGRVNNSVITNNEIHDFCRYGIRVTSLSYKNIISYNKIYNNWNKKGCTSGDRCGIATASDLSQNRPFDTVIEYNDLYNNGFYGTTYDYIIHTYGSTGTTIRHNTIHDNNQAALACTVSKNVIIKDNIIYNNNVKVMWRNTTALNGVHFNIGNCKNVDASNNIIYGNTLDAANDYLSIDPKNLRRSWALVNFDVSSTGAFTKNIVANNYLKTKGQFPTVLMLRFSPEQIINNNLYYNNRHEVKVFNFQAFSDLRLVKQFDKVDCDIPLWLNNNEPDNKWKYTYRCDLTEAHTDADGIEADPLFVAPSSGDFSLRSGSPASALGFK